MNKKLDRIVIIGMVSALFFCFVTPLMSGDLDKPYNPSRKEWLELSLFKLIKDKTDLWEQRIGFIVWIIENDGEIMLTLSSANGQEPLSDTARDEYVKQIKSAVELFIQQFEWAKNLKVIVQFS